jgi:twitching motility protein PilT
MQTNTPSIADLLASAFELGGSDLSIKAGSRPALRVDGKLRWLDEQAVELRAGDTRQLLYEILPESQIAAFERDHEVDFAYSISNPQPARFRVNAFLQRGAVSMVFRLVPDHIRSIEELGLPEIVRTLADEERGIVLITGSSGAGKSTTLAAMVEHINTTSFRHVVTIEDPIEFIHHDKRSIIEQREIGTDTDSFESAMRRVLRQDPDVIMIGEMRDEATVRTALAAAETGHLVLSTLHTLDAPESINRMLDFFPAAQHDQARAMIAATLKGIVSQRLVPRADGSGRTAIAEVMTMTGRVNDLIRNPRTDARLSDVIAQGAYYGMQTFDQALYTLVQSGEVALADARRFASQSHDLQLRIATRSNGEPRASALPS